jgi:metallophosphoesterase superfamily enzyme
VPALAEPPFHFVHEPATPLSTERTTFTVAGHLHPTVSIRSPAGDRIADRCFAAEEALLVLPAFGSFTGGHRVTATDKSLVWIARDDGVVDVSRMVQLAR